MSIIYCLEDDFKKMERIDAELKAKKARRVGESNKAWKFRLIQEEKQEDERSRKFFEFFIPISDEDIKFQQQIREIFKL